MCATLLDPGSLEGWVSEVVAPAQDVERRALVIPSDKGMLYVAIVINLGQLAAMLLPLEVD